jgi:hypothetical protein
MNYLAQQLKKYYRRKGNQVMFNNGENLNQISLSMWSKLGFCEVDAGVLSRVINGKRLFTPKQLNVFCKLIDLNKQERLKLSQALAIDILQRAGLQEDFISLSDSAKATLDFVFQQMNNLIFSVRFLRNRGLPLQAIETATFMEEIANFYMDKYPKEWAKKEIAFLQLFNERARAWGEIAIPTKIEKLMLHDTKRALAIGFEKNNSNLINMGHMNIGGAYYVAKKWRESAEYLDNAFRQVDINTQIEFLRTMILDYAYLKDRNSFKNIRKKHKIL